MPTFKLFERVPSGPQQGSLNLVMQVDGTIPAKGDLLAVAGHLYEVYQVTRIYSANPNSGMGGPSYPMETSSNVFTDRRSPDIVY